MTFIMVTHDQSDALALSNRIAILSKGNIEQVGTPKEIVTSPSNTFVTLNAVSLEISEHEFFCIIGPSGCGKSTLLKLLAGVEKPSGGEIFYNGSPIFFIPITS